MIEPREFNNLQERECNYKVKSYERTNHQQINFDKKRKGMENSFNEIMNKLNDTFKTKKSEVCTVMYLFMCIYVSAFCEIISSFSLRSTLGWIINTKEISSRRIWWSCQFFVLLIFASVLESTIYFSDDLNGRCKTANSMKIFMRFSIVFHKCYTRDLLIKLCRLFQ